MRLATDFDCTSMLCVMHVRARHGGELRRRACNHPHRRRVKMTRLRQRVAERLKGAQNTYAMLSTFNEVDMSSIIEMRNTYKVGSCNMRCEQSTLYMSGEAGGLAA